MRIEPPKQALGHLRVLDLADEKGVYCAKLLADLGADTIKVEPPGGHPTRSIGPFVDDVPHPERSLHWFHYNTNKRSITLDLTQSGGQALFKGLIKTADVVVESFQPGYLDSFGLGYTHLEGLNPRIILTSITGFGQTGPYRDYLTSDIVAWAMSGFLYTCGYPWTPPMRPYGSQASHTACHYGAVGTLAALLNRRFTGKGQHIDVSMQEAVAAISEHSNMSYVHDKVIHGRRPNEHTAPGQSRRFPCKDGWVELYIELGPRWEGLVTWMAEEGMAESLLDPRWNDRHYHQQHLAEAYSVIERWSRTHSKEELFTEGNRRRLPWGSVRTIGEAIQDKQLNERGFFVRVEHPELGRSLRYSGAPYKFGETPWAIRRRAPLIGEHNEEIYIAELGLSKEDLVILKEACVI